MLMKNIKMITRNSPKESLKINIIVKSLNLQKVEKSYKITNQVPYIHYAIFVIIVSSFFFLGQHM